MYDLAPAVLHGFDDSQQFLLRGLVSESRRAINANINVISILPAIRGGVT
jgi:hypothetical protein